MQVNYYQMLEKLGYLYLIICMEPSLAATFQSRIFIIGIDCGIACPEPSPRFYRGRDAVPRHLGYPFFSHIALIISRIKAGRSSGIRDVTKFPSLTTSAFIYSAPAFTMSSLIALTQVTFLPLSIPAETNTHPAWQIAPITFP